MPPRARQVKNYSDEDLQLAVEAVRDGMSVRNASKEHNVPKSTLMDRCIKKHSNIQGRPTVLTRQEEVLIKERVKVMSEWGFPFTRYDLCHFVKSYLDKKGVSKSRFKDNMPTRRFVDTFLKRHKDFVLRNTNPIKRSRAQLSREEVKKFFTYYARTVYGVPPENLFNFDESNLRDDPGLKKCIFKKGTKYCEKVQNTSKQEEFMRNVFSNP